MVKSYVYALIIFLSACATTIPTSNVNKISLGMTKSEVIRILGEPSKSSASSGQEIFEYEVRGGDYSGCLTAAGIFTLGIASADCQKLLDNLAIIFKNGKVDSYVTR